MIAHLKRKADLRLPHAFAAALAPAVQEENDGPVAVIVPPILFGQVDLEAVAHALVRELPVEETGLLRGSWGVRPGVRRGAVRGHEQKQCPKAKK